MVRKCQSFRAEKQKELAMKLITLKAHMYFDGLVAVMLMTAPWVIQLERTAVAICFALALIHTLVTILAFVPSDSMISHRVHGWIEFFVAPAIGSLPWVLGFSIHKESVIFFSVLSGLIFLVWALTNYGQEESKLRFSRIPKN